MGLENKRDEQERMTLKNFRVRWTLRRLKKTVQHSTVVMVCSKRSPTEH